ncbi:MAG: penicillin-binding protein 1C [Anaerolineales bacterium]|nr:penicillin-binding protein 1C [Anaerolineales bacterium]
MRRIKTTLFIFAVVLAALAAAGMAWLFTGLPSPDSLPERLNTPSVRITDRNGRLLYDLLPEQGGRHAVLPLESIPQELQQATIATEDRSFYSNPGVDLRGVARAVWQYLSQGQALSGGSTLTQQVARNLLMEQGERAQRSLRRKLREMILAWQLTRRLEKDEILALYLNQTYYGGMAYGVEAAAQTFFGKPASQLDLAESALLAGLPQSPALYNPFTDPQSSKERQIIVLGLMEQAGFITSEERQLAEREPLIFTEQPYPIEAPHFVMMVRRQLDSLFTPELIYQSGGLVVRTSLDLDWQKHAERAIQRQLAALKDSQDGQGHNVNSAALVALDPNSGEILALVGSPDFFDPHNAGAINMVTSPRQPGSALKPIIYAAALDPTTPPNTAISAVQGTYLPPAPWTAATMLLDVRTAFLTHEGLTYLPANYDLREHGPVLLRNALGSSLNIPAVLTLDHVGLKNLFTLASRLGMTTFGDPENYDLSLALGGGEVRLLELSAAYGALANGGFRVDPVAILQVSDLQGQVLYAAPPPAQQRVLDERIAWLVSDILSDDDARRIGFGAHTILNLDRPAAVKTGTTSNFHDNWTVGYTPSLVVGVWAGNTDFRPMRDVNGLTGAAPVWHQFMRAVLTGSPVQEFTRPEGLEQVEICALSGLLPTEACAYRRLEWFLAGTAPTRLDSLYREALIDIATGQLADEQAPPERRRKMIVLDLPVQAQPWARSQGLTLFSDLTAPLIQAETASPAEAQTSLQIVSPAANAVFILSPGLNPQAQRIRLEAVVRPGLRQVRLVLDGQALASFESGPYLAWWTLAPGQHRLWAEAVDENGARVVSPVVVFEVRK